MNSYRGVVLHVNAANSGDLYWWITRPNSDMSCHFQVLKDGTIYQYIDTDLSSWCQGYGNNDWISIETSGFPNEPLTPQQVASCAIIMAFCHQKHGVPLQETNSTSGTGFGWHGMGGDAWGNHPACPGDLRKAQRKDILNRAKQLLSPDSQSEEDEDDMKPVVTITTHPTNGRKRAWILGPLGLAELKTTKENPQTPEAQARAMAELFGVKPVETSEVYAAVALPNSLAYGKAF